MKEQVKIGENCFYEREHLTVLLDIIAAAEGEDLWVPPEKGSERQQALTDLCTCGIVSHDTGTLPDIDWSQVTVLLLGFGLQDLGVNPDEEEEQELEPPSAWAENLSHHESVVDFVASYVQSIAMNPTCGERQWETECMQTASVGFFNALLKCVPGQFYEDPEDEELAGVLYDMAERVRGIIQPMELHFTVAMASTGVGSGYWDDE